jgi:HAD superfamily hydrolase (TIGR01509 family)
MNSKIKIKAALFDLDGTLAKTEDLKGQAIAAAVGHFGKSVDFLIYKKVMGQSWEKVTSHFFQSVGLEVSLSEFNPIFRNEYGKLIDSRLAPDTSTEKFLLAFKRQGIKVGVVSSASPWMIDKVLSKFENSVQFDVIISNADTQNHKPHPEPYLVALKKLEIESFEAVAFEDSETGFSSAYAAGIKVYGRRHDFNQTHNFSTCQKTFLSFDELKEDFLPNPSIF